MISNNSNSWASQAVTGATVQRNIDMANTCHNVSKGKAAEAAAHIYLVWLSTLSPNAEDIPRKWMEKLIEERNKEIDAHNKDLPKGSQRQLRVETKANANPFTEIVKFVLGFRQASDASLISRYAAVVGWIHQTFATQPINDITEIIGAISTVGGFEAAIAEFRKKDTGNRARDAWDADGKLDATILGAIRTAAANNVALQSYPSSIAGTENLVIALGRYGGGKVELVSTVCLPATGTDDLLRLFATELGPKAPGSISFVGNVLDLADLIEEGRLSQHKEDGLTAGKPLKEERVLALTPECLLITARYADACVVLKARPAQTVSLRLSTTPIMLEKSDCDRLAAFIGNRAVRPLMSVNFAPDWSGPDDVQWAITKGDATDVFAWIAVGPQVHKPMTVDAFVASCAVDIAKSAIVQLLVDRLEAWESNQTALRKAAKAAGTSSKVTKTRKVIALTFEEGSLRYAMDGDAPLELPASGTMQSPVQLSFRPRDLLVLFRKLAGLPVATFQLAADERGMLRVSWSDSFGSYEVYQPVVNSRGHLETRCFAPLRGNFKRAA